MAISKSRSLSNDISKSRATQSINEVDSLCSLVDHLPLKNIIHIGYSDIIIINGLNILMSVFHPQINQHSNTFGIIAQQFNICNYDNYGMNHMIH